jgi:hypothetical protein
VAAQGEWFEVDPREEEPRHRSGRFLNALRQHAVGWTDLGIEPSDTSFSGGYALVELQGLSCAARHLHLEYWFDRAHGPKLLGEWADEWCFDNSEDAADLIVRGTDLSPKQMAAIAAAWIERQLRAPVLRQEWLSTTHSGEQRVERRRWVASDTQLIHDDAPWPLRLVPPRRAPDWVIEERPDRRAPR